MTQQYMWLLNTYQKKKERPELLQDQTLKENFSKNMRKSRKYIIKLQS